MTLNVYTFENAAHHILRTRVPLFPWRQLTAWYASRSPVSRRWAALEYVVIRARGCVQMMDALDLTGQTSEFARVFGIEFYHVLSRGSQVGGTESFIKDYQERNT